MSFDEILKIIFYCCCSENALKNILIFVCFQDFMIFKKPKNISWVRVAWIRNCVFPKNENLWFLLSGWTVVSKRLKKLGLFAFFGNPYSCNPYSRDAFGFLTKNGNVDLRVYGVLKNWKFWKCIFLFLSTPYTPKVVFSFFVQNSKPSRE